MGKEPREANDPLGFDKLVKRIDEMSGEGSPNPSAHRLQKIGPM
jgi:hypothetical protein